MAFPIPLASRDCCHGRDATAATCPRPSCLLGRAGCSTPEQEDPSSSVSSRLALTWQVMQDLVAGMWGADGSGAGW